MTIQRREYKRDGGKAKVAYHVYVYNKYLGRKEWVGSFDRKEDARAAEVQTLNRIRLGEARVERKEIGFSDLVDRWLETANVRKTTLAEYRYTSNHLRAYFRNRVVSQIGREDVRRFVSTKLKSGFSDRYVRRMAIRLSQILNIAVEWGYINVSPMTGMKKYLPDEPKRDVRLLTPAEVRALIDAAPPYWRSAFMVLVMCGLRRSELWGLRAKEDLDLEAGLIHVRFQLVEGELVKPKTPAAVRSIPLPSVVAAELKSHIANVPPNDLGLLFPTELGRPITPSNWYKRVWKPAVLRSGVREDLTPHDLRKQFASIVVKKNHGAAYLQSVMGHTKASTTLSYYTEAFPDEGVRAAADLDDWLAEEANATYPAPGQLAPRLVVTAA